MAFTLPALPYAYDALEPNIDKQTMEIHHDKHHAGYVNNLNKAIAGTEYENMSLDDILKVAGKAGNAVRNNAGGHWNHTFFWEIMGPDGGGKPEGELAKAIDEAFGSFEAMKEKFNAAGAGRFGSGWAWLAVDNSGKLVVCSSPNQDNPLMDVAECACTPILGCDVWEHAYYLKYQNKRADYLNAFWNCVNWDKVAEHYKNAK
ncbi:MAG: superoxide dismutase [Chitinophagaceae bacterium]|nr:superoxide dismutase [Chitinophagaceae bacterium]MCZ2397345.1 superoxide dismutase [Chitinophagales bacterium]